MNPKISSHHRFERALSIVFVIIALALLICVFLSVPVVASVFGSRLKVVAFSILCGSFALILHPELRDGFAQGLREFFKASREVRDEIGKLF